MQQKFKLHQIVYMIAAGKQIKEMVVMKYAGGFYTVRYRDTGGGLRVRESRLYATKAEAEKAGGIGLKRRYERYHGGERSRYSPRAVRL